MRGGVLGIVYRVWRGTGLVLIAFRMFGLRLTLLGNQMWHLFEWAEGMRVIPVVRWVP